MSIVIKATFTNSFAHASESRNATTPIMVRPALHRLMTVTNWIYTILTGVGTMAIILFFLNDTPSIAYLFVIFAGALVVYGFTYINIYIDRAAYADFTKTDFGATNSVEIDADSFTLISTHSRWTTGWQDVKDTFRTENTLGIVTPTMPIYIPASALKDPDAVFAQMNTWHKAAIAQ